MAKKMKKADHLDMKNSSDCEEDDSTSSYKQSSNATGNVSYSEEDDEEDDLKSSYNQSTNATGDVRDSEEDDGKSSYKQSNNATGDVSDSEKDNGKSSHKQGNNATGDVRDSEEDDGKSSYKQPNDAKGDVRDGEEDDGKSPYRQSQNYNAISDSIDIGDELKSSYNQGYINENFLATSDNIPNLQNGIEPIPMNINQDLNTRSNSFEIRFNCIAITILTKAVCTCIVMFLCKWLMKGLENKPETLNSTSTCYRGIFYLFYVLNSLAIVSLLKYTQVQERLVKTATFKLPKWASFRKRFAHTTGQSHISAIGRTIKSPVKFYKMIQNQCSQDKLLLKKELVTDFQAKESDSNTSKEDTDIIKNKLEYIALLSTPSQAFYSINFQNYGTKVVEVNLSSDIMSIFLTLEKFPLEKEGLTLAKLMHGDNNLVKTLFDRFWIITPESFQEALLNCNIIQQQTLGYITIHPRNARLPVELPVQINSYLGRKSRINEEESAEHYLLIGLKELNARQEYVEGQWKKVAKY